MADEDKRKLDVPSLGGPVSGTVRYGYDAFFRPTAIAVNADTVALT